MSKKYYVIGRADTRGEFYPEGVTTTKVKANKFKDELQKDLYENARQWIAIKEVKGI